VSEGKSQNASGSLRLVRGLRFWVWIKSGNFEGSRMKNTGVLLPVMSQLPSCSHRKQKNKNKK